MLDEGPIEVAASTWIPRSELRFFASRSGGPGGQHVNKTNSRVTLEFDLTATGALTVPQKQRIARFLATRITQAGLFKLHVQKHRSQAANREVAVERFQTLLRAALAPVKRRKPTRPSKAAKERRLTQKARKSELKKQRTNRF